MNKKNKVLVILIFCFIFFYLFLYKDFLFSDKILFPSNFLVQFFNPWSTKIFSGWEQGVPHKPIGVDQLRFFYPSRIFSNEAFSRFEIPLWNPYIFSGNPHVANFQSGVFYPLSLIYLILPTMTAWSLLIFIEPIIALIGTYLYLRSIKLTKIASFFGAFVFGFSGFMTVWSQENTAVPHTALWLPFIMWSIESWFIEKKARFALLLIIFLTTCFLAGFFQLAFYIYIFTFIYGFFRLIFSKINILFQTFKLTILFIVAILTTGVQLIPSIEGFLNSPRTTVNVWYLFETYLLPFTHFINILIPDIFGNPGSYNFFGRGFYHETVTYVGIIPFIFALFSLSLFKNNFYVKFFSVAAAFTFFLTLESPFTRWFYKLPIPLISVFLPSRILIISTFALSVLSGFGMERLINLKKIPKSIILIIFIVIGLAISCLVFAIFLKNNILSKEIASFIIRPSFVWKEDYFFIIIKNTLLQLSFVLVMFFSLIFLNKKFAIPLLIFVTIISQLYFFQKYLVLGTKFFLFPSHEVFDLLSQKSIDYSRFVSLGSPISSNISLLEKLYSPEGLDPIFSNNYGLLSFAAMNNGEFTKDIPRIEVNLSNIDNSMISSSNSKYIKILSLMGVKHFLYHKPQIENEPGLEFKEAVFKKLAIINNWTLYENLSVLPRAFLVYEFKTVSDEKKLLDMMLDDETNLGKTIFLKKILDKKLKQGVGSATIDIYSNHRMQITTSSSQEALLFLSDTFYPGWKAKIDGVPVEIYQANLAFRAVSVPEGVHKVTFSYEPDSFKHGAMLTSVGILTMLFVAWYSSRNRTL